MEEACSDFVHVVMREVYKMKTPCCHASASDVVTASRVHRRLLLMSCCKGLYGLTTLMMATAAEGCTSVAALSDACAPLTDGTWPLLHLAVASGSLRTLQVTLRLFHLLSLGKNISFLSVQSFNLCPTCCPTKRLAVSTSHRMGAARGVKSSWDDVPALTASKQLLDCLSSYIPISNDGNERRSVEDPV